MINLIKFQMFSINKPYRIIFLPIIFYFILGSIFLEYNCNVDLFNKALNVDVFEHNVKLILLLTLSVVYILINYLMCAFFKAPNILIYSRMKNKFSYYQIHLLILMILNVFYWLIYFLVLVSFFTFTNSIDLYIKDILIASVECLLSSIIITHLLLTVNNITNNVSISLTLIVMYIYFSYFFNKDFILSAINQPLNANNFKMQDVYSICLLFLTKNALLYCFNYFYLKRRIIIELYHKIKSH